MGCRHIHNNKLPFGFGVFYSSLNEGGRSSRKDYDQKDILTFLGRTDSASWSREERRKLREAEEAGRRHADTLVGGCEPVFTEQDYQSRIRRRLRRI